MKKSLKIMSFLLALVVLGNSIGIAVFEHTCNYSGTSSKTLFKSHACCAVDKAEVKILKSNELSFSKGECCDTDENLAIPNLFSSLNEHLKVTPLSYFLVNCFFNYSFIEASSTAYLKFVDCTGPPLAQRLRLHQLYQVYVI